MGNVEQERAKRMGDAVSNGLATVPKDGVVKSSGGEEAPETLRPKQQRALELLVGGMPVEKLADEVGVHRSTVYVWLKKDSAFQAAHNQWLEQLDVEARSRSKVLMRKAGDAVEKALDGGDGRLGLRLLEKMGIVKEGEVGPTEAGEVEMERKVERKKKDLERRKLEAEIKESEMNPFL